MRRKRKKPRGFRVDGSKGEGNRYGEILKEVDLKYLHLFLSKISSNVSCYEDGDALSAIAEASFLGGPMRSMDILSFGDALFTELEARFAKIVLGGFGKPCATSLFPCVQDLVFLLRCCSIMLHVLEFNLTHVMEKGRVLLGIFREVLHLEGNKGWDESRACDGYMNVNPSEPCNESSSTRVPLKCLLMEVIMDEMLMSKHLHKHLRICELFSDELDKLFASPTNQPIGFIMEILSTHLVLWIEDKGFPQLCSSLFWSCKSGRCSPFVSLSALLCLLENSILFSLPCILRTHILLLASSCIGISKNRACQDLKFSSLDHYMVAFEWSVDLYRRILQGIKMPSDKSYGLCFETFVRPTTRSRIEHHTSKLSEWFNGYFHSMITENTMDKESIAMAYVKENEYIVDEPFKEEMFLFVRYIISMSSSTISSHPTFDAIVGNGWQSLFSAAACMKLMSSALLHIINTLKQTGGCDRKKWTDDASSKAYDCVLGVILSLTHCGLELVNNMLDFSPEPFSSDVKQDGSQVEMMLAHFIGLFLYSINRGIVFLWKGSILMVLVLLNLMWLDMGHTEQAVCDFHENDSSISASSPKSSSFRLSNKSVCRHKMSSVAIASRFLQSRSFYLKGGFPCSTDEIGNTQDRAIFNLHGKMDNGGQLSVRHKDIGTSSSCMAERNDISLKSIGFNRKDADELADFVYCTPGKDYFDWLRKKTMFRKWKARKQSTLRRQRRITAWACLGKKSTNS